MHIRQLRRTLPFLGVLVVLAIFLAHYGDIELTQAIGPTETTPNFKVAFVGDQGLGSNAEAVLQLILSEGADMVLHQGDFGYNETDPQTPTNWDNQITSILGADFPYFGSVGNHDVGQWGEYQQLLQVRLGQVSGATCTGDLGVQAACHYNGLFFILSGAGTIGTGHGTYLRDQLALDDSVWSICSWHKNQNAMQVGTKLDEVGWAPYEECRLGGAIIATAHEHSYERTKTLSNMEFQTVDPLWSEPNALRVGGGSSFAFVSGISGHSIRNQDRCLPTSYPYGCNGEWASIYTSDQIAEPGALFIEFHVDGDPRKAQGYFKNINGIMIDSFTLMSDLDNTIPPPPDAPSELTATAMSTSQIQLAWTDNSDNESGFEVERSIDAAAWQLAATVSADSTEYTDSSLDPSTTYYYRVRSYNSQGGSSFSNVAQATTEDPPAYVEDVASSDIPGSGTVSGTYTDTQIEDDVHQVLTERLSGGKPQDRHSYLVHTWLFNVQGGNVVTFGINGYMDPSTDEDTFVVAYSTDNLNYTDMISVTTTGVDSTYQSYALPNTTQGQVYVRVKDTDQTAGNQTLDTLYIDHMYIRSETAPGSPPNPPSGLTATSVIATQVDLRWTPGSTDEIGFEIERSPDSVAWSIIGSTGAGITAYSDTGVSPSTTYQYRVRAFNASGFSLYSASISVTTPDGISLTATGYKVKGVQHVDLTWSGTTGLVDVFRDGSPIETNNDLGSYTDNIGNNGGGSYEYQACKSGSLSECSNIVNVVF